MMRKQGANYIGIRQQFGVFKTKMMSAQSDLYKEALKAHANNSKGKLFVKRKHLKTL